MKKIIALAVATAFVAPVMAADVTLTGDVEYKVSNKAGVTGGSVGDSDFKISFSEETGGLSVSGYLDFEEATSATDPASALVIAGSFGTVSVGDDIGSAVGSFDEITDKAEAGGGGSDAGGDLTNKTIGVKYAVPTGVEGLNLHVGTEFGNTTTEEQSTSFAVQYTVGAITGFYGSDDADDAEPINAYGLSGTFGPIYVAYETINNVSGVLDDEHTGVAIVYNYGMGNVTYETNETEDASAGTKTEQNALSISYQLGAVNTYVAMSDTGSTSDDTTTVGVEYAF
jgi:hypothetical protein